MAVTIAFDAYGTLFDTTSVDRALEKYVGDKALDFAFHWRQKQLEFSFRRGLMRKYAPFNVCIADALRYVTYLYGLELEQVDIDSLLAEYTQLKCFDDVVPALQSLQNDGHQIMILSNGHPEDLRELIENNSLQSYIQEVVSVHEIASFKPNPEVYQLFIERADTKKEQAWLVSGNTFDFVGAISFGMKGVYIQRGTDVAVEPWEVEPTASINSLGELPALLNRVS